VACNNRWQGVWCISFCQTWKLFQSITSSLIRSTAEEERVKNQNIIKITSNVLKEAWWNDKWKEEARSSRAFCSKIGLGLGSGGGVVGRNFQRHCPSRTAVPQVIPTDWKLQPCVVSTDSEVREPVGNCRQELFKVPQERYVREICTSRGSGCQDCGFFVCDVIHITPKHCFISCKTVMWTLQILIHWRTLRGVNVRYLQWSR
jgi:hypothetical protein